MVDQNRIPILRQTQGTGNGQPTTDNRQLITNNKDIKVKVCGITREEDLAALSLIGVDYAGFIFYPHSPRFVEGKLKPKEIKKYQEVKRVGVFVNEKKEAILKKADLYGLDLVQLHGDESPEFCKEIQETVPVMKAFRIKSRSDVEQTKKYEPFCSYFLFDTSSDLYGGSGKKFDWKLLAQYQGSKPFFLSGGIRPEDVRELQQFSHPQWRAIDINSGFETAPGEKNIKAIKDFLWDLNII